MPSIDVRKTTESAQNDLVRAFESGEVDGAPAPVTRIDTHLNHIFLSGDRAYKLKRAVRLPFVDFQPPSRRHEACRAEVSVNQKLGSPFYLGVAAIGRDQGGAYHLVADGEGEDWVVVMKRFDVSTQFDVLADNGRLTVALAEAAASVIAGMHERAAPNQLAGHTADYRGLIQNLRRTEEEAAARYGLTIGHPDPYDRLDFELARMDHLIEERRASGKVRRAHGDLHLRNICMFEGKATPFDALEFDDRLATADVLYDLAFFLMDLRRAGLASQANAAMNRYWDVTAESECALALLPFFMALRATVRMAVAVESGSLQEADEYRSLALDLLDRRAPATLAIGGLSGTGKSALARETAAFLPGPCGARILRSDVLRKRAAGLALNSKADPACYSVSRRAEIYRDLVARVAIAGRAGASVIADATFQSSESRDALAAAAPHAHRFWLEASLSVRLLRIGSRHGDASDADAAVAVAQEAPALKDSEWRALDAKRSVPDLAATVLKAIR